MPKVRMKSRIENRMGPIVGDFVFYGQPEGRLISEEKDRACVKFDIGDGGIDSLCLYVAPDSFEVIQ